MFLEENQWAFLQLRNTVIRAMNQTGVVRLENLMVGDSWLCMAFFDRMVELEEIREIKQDGITGQDRIFVPGIRFPTRLS